MVAGIVGVVILLLLFFVVRACNNTRHDNALRDYNRQVSGLGDGVRSRPASSSSSRWTPPRRLAGRALPGDPRLQGRGRQHAQAGPGAQRPGRHVLRAAVAADPARAAPRRPGTRSPRRSARRSATRGRPPTRRSRRSPGRHARVRRVRRPVRRARDPVHQGGVLRRRGRRADDRAVAVPERDLLGLAAVRRVALGPAALPDAGSGNGRRRRRDPTSRPARACTAPAWTPPPTAA